MKSLILAAGYGTRMQSLIGDAPKALIEIGGRTLLDRVVEQLHALELPVHLVTNDLHLPHFEAWRCHASIPVEMVSDGTSCVEQRLGAVGDLQFALRHFALDDDLLLLAADNLLDFDLGEFVAAFRARREVHIAVWTNPDSEDQRRRGVVTLGADQRIVGFEEKPDEPRSDLAAAPIYLLPRESLGEVGPYLDAGGNADAPGHFLAHLVQRVSARAWDIPGALLDVGNPQSYADAQRRFGG